MIEDLRPYWLLSGKEIRRRSVQVGLLPSVDLVRIEDGKTRTIDVNTGFDDAEVGARAKGFRVMLEKFQGESERSTRQSARDSNEQTELTWSSVLIVLALAAKLPDMDFPINEKAEGRILVPWEQNKFSNLTVDSSSKSRSALSGCCAARPS